jgi:hypothetical protein
MRWCIPHWGCCLLDGLCPGYADVVQQVIIQPQQGLMLFVQRLRRKVAVQQAKYPWAVGGAAWGANGGREIAARRGGHGVSFLLVFDLTIIVGVCIRMLDWYAPFCYI